MALQLGGFDIDVEMDVHSSESRVAPTHPTVRCPAVAYNYLASAEQEASGGPDMHSIQIKELQEKVHVLKKIIMNCPTTKKNIYMKTPT